jgi:hypothetical protein
MECGLLFPLLIYLTQRHMKTSSVFVFVQIWLWASIFIHCSIPRSLPQFDDQSDKIKREESNLNFDSYSSTASGSGSYVEKTYSAPTPSDEILFASTSEKIFFPEVAKPKKEIFFVQKINRQPARNVQDEKTKTGDNKKNGFAVLGFWIIVAGLSLGITIPLTVATSWPLVFVPIGIVLCGIGLKSQRKGWAKAGLIIGGLAVLFALIAAIMVSSFKFH